MNTPKLLTNFSNDFLPIYHFCVDKFNNDNADVILVIQSTARCQDGTILQNHSALYCYVEKINLTKFWNFLNVISTLYNHYNIKL